MKLRAWTVVEGREIVFMVMERSVPGAPIGQDRRNLTTVPLFRSLALLTPPSPFRRPRARHRGGREGSGAVGERRPSGPLLGDRSASSPPRTGPSSPPRGSATGGSAWAKGPYVVVDGTAVYAVAVGDAQAAGTTPEALASTWAKALNAAFHVKPLELEDEFVTLPVGGLRGLRLKGSGGGPRGAPNGQRERRDGRPHGARRGRPRRRAGPRDDHGAGVDRHGIARRDGEAERGDAAERAGRRGDGRAERGKHGDPAPSRAR